MGCIVASVGYWGSGEATTFIFFVLSLTSICGDLSSHDHITREMRWWWCLPTQVTYSPLLCQLGQVLVVQKCVCVCVCTRQQMERCVWHDSAWCNGLTEVNYAELTVCENACTVLYCICVCMSVNARCLGLSYVCIHIFACMYVRRQQPISPLRVCVCVCVTIVSLLWSGQSIRPCCSLITRGTHMHSHVQTDTHIHTFGIRAGSDEQ